MHKIRIFKYEDRAVILVGMAFGVVFFDRLALNFLAPFLMSELHLNNTQLGTLVGCLALAWAISGYVVGALSDYLQSRKVLLVSALLIFSTCSVGSGLATTFLALWLSRFVMGLAEGPVLPLAQSIIFLESSAHRRGFNMGVVQNFFSSIFSYFLAPLILVGIATTYGWRNAFCVAAVPGFVIAGLIVAFVREPASPSGSASHWRRPGPSSLKLLMSHRNIWVCAILSCLLIAWVLIQLTFLPIYLVQARGFSSGEMSIALSAVGVAATLGSAIVPALSDRFGRRPVLMFFAFASVVAPITIALFEGPTLVMALVMGIGFLSIGSFSIFIATIPSETLPQNCVAGAIGLLMGLGEVTGGFIGPSLAGLAADKFGLASPMWIAAALAIAAGLTCVMLEETWPGVVARTRTDASSSTA